MHKKLSILFQYFIPQHTLSRFAGYIAESKIIWLKNLLIHWFIRCYKIDLSAAQHPDVKDYPNFNAFFTRALKPALRSIDTNPSTICSPADGTVSQFGKIQQDAILQAKGINYSLGDLLKEKAQQNYVPFIEGQFITIYLSPRDYHRVHMPIDAELYRADYIPGKLFSVNQTSVNHIKGLFGHNERLVCYFRSQSKAISGDFILIMVGAMLVAGIETSWSEAEQNKLAEQPLSFTKGDEIGRFKFGSTVILLLNNQNTLEWHNAIQPEHHLQFGETLALSKT